MDLTKWSYHSRLWKGFFYWKNISRLFDEWYYIEKDGGINMKKIICGFILIICFFLLAGCGKENKARETAEDYMDAVKNGDDYEDLYLDEGFIDLFSYEYLKTLDPPKEKDTRTVEYDFWEEFYKDETDTLFPTFDEYKQSYLDTEDTLEREYEILQDDNEILEYWDGESYKEIHKFLYNVEIADEFGQKLYKKAEITVEMGLVEEGEDYKDGYVITDVYLR